MLVYKKFNHSKKAGFTLIELLVTTTITTILLLTATTIMMTFFLSNSRTSIRRQIKSEGSRALARIEFIARGAKSCTDNNGITNTTGSDITFTNIDNSTIRFWAEDVNGVRNLRMRTTPASGPVTTENLLSDFALASSGTDFILSCVRETNANKLYANILFKLTNPGTGLISETFTTLVVLRNSQ